MVYMSWFHSWHAHPYVAVLHYVSQEAKQRRSFVILVHGIDSRWRWEASSWWPFMCQQQHKCWMDWLFLLRMICLVGSGRVYGSTNLSLLCFATLRGDPIQLFLFAFTTLFFSSSFDLFYKLFLGYHAWQYFKTTFKVQQQSTQNKMSAIESIERTQVILSRSVSKWILHPNLNSIRCPNVSYTRMNHNKSTVLSSTWWSFLLYIYIYITYLSGPVQGHIFFFSIYLLLYWFPSNNNQMIYMYNNNQRRRRRSLAGYLILGDSSLLCCTKVTSLDPFDCLACHAWLCVQVCCLPFIYAFCTLVFSILLCQLYLFPMNYLWMYFPFCCYFECAFNTILGCKLSSFFLFTFPLFY